MTENAARESALGYAAKAMPSAQAPTAAAKLMIVMPNSYWVARGLGEAEDNTLARTAWVVTVQDQGAQLIFWLDAADGRLLGGTQSKGAVRLPAASGGPAASVEAPGGGWLRPLGIGLLAASVLLVAAAFLLPRRSPV